MNLKFNFFSSRIKFCVNASASAKHLFCQQSQLARHIMTDSDWLSTIKSDIDWLLAIGWSIYINQVKINCPNLLGRTRRRVLCLPPCYLYKSGGSGIGGAGVRTYNLTSHDQKSYALLLLDHTTQVKRLLNIHVAMWLYLVLFLSLYLLLLNSPIPLMFVIKGGLHDEFCQYYFRL